MYAWLAWKCHWDFGWAFELLDFYDNFQRYMKVSRSMYSVRSSSARKKNHAQSMSFSLESLAKSSQYFSAQTDPEIAPVPKTLPSHFLDYLSYYNSCLQSVPTWSWSELRKWCFLPAKLLSINLSLSNLKYFCDYILARIWHQQKKSLFDHKKRKTLHALRSTRAAREPSGATNRCLWLEVPCRLPW